MEILKSLENMLAPLFKAPEMPAGGKKWFVKWLPVLALVFGILQLLAALTLWQAWNRVDDVVDFANQVAQTYGVGSSVSKPALWFWLGLLSLLLSAVILLMAYSPLKQKRKRGWYLLFLGAVLQVIYAVIVLFVGADYGGGFGNFIFSLIGSAIGFWILFQIREGYGKQHTEVKS